MQGRQPDIGSLGYEVNDTGLERGVWMLDAVGVGNSAAFDSAADCRAARHVHSAAALATALLPLERRAPGD